jgi:hypothetical protein
MYVDISKINLVRSKCLVFKITSRLFHFLVRSYLSLSPCVFGFIVSGIKAMPHNQNTFIERDLFNQFSLYTQLNPATYVGTRHGAPSSGQFLGTVTK